MPLYKYRAKKGPEDIIVDTIEAASETEAIEKVNQMGYVPVNIESYTDAAMSRSQKAKPVSSFRVQSREITVISRQLSSLLKSGVPILDALNIISDQSNNPDIKNIFKNIHTAVKAGATFSSTLSEYPRVFPYIYVSMVRTGENSGTLHEALLRIADYRAKQEEMLSRFRMALAYPVLMAAVGIGTVIFMLAFVMPRLMGIFNNMGQELPLPTKILISISTYLQQGWLWAVIILFLGTFIVSQKVKSKAGKLFSSRLKLRLPIYGKLILKSELSRFNRTLELLVKSGVPILNAIDISIPVLENEVIKSELARCHEDLEQGGSFGRSLKQSKIIPSFMSNLIIVGEESGKLNEALTEVAISYEHDTDESMRVMASVLEPMMILSMGLIVGFIVVSMLLPIFEINVMTK